MAPAGTPKEIVAKWNAEVTRILRSPEMKAFFAQQGAEPAPDSPEQFAALIKSETLGTRGSAWQAFGCRPGRSLPSRGRAARPINRRAAREACVPGKGSVVRCPAATLMTREKIMRGMLRWALGALFACIATVASAQSYPNRTIRLVVPFPAAGTTDILARAAAQKLTEAFGQAVVVDNRPGAAGNIGSDLVAKSAPDGYTLLMGTVGTHAINPSLYSKMPYDHVKDFVPVVLVAGVPNVLVVNPALPVNSVADLIKLAKDKPGQINFASSGSGTSIHLSGELFKTMAGVDMTHVPYKGSSPALTDLIGGQVQIMFDNLPSALPQIKAGKLRAIAVTSLKARTRAARHPDHQRKWTSRLRGKLMVRCAGSRRHAGADRRQDQRRGQ